MNRPNPCEAGLRALRWLHALPSADLWQLTRTDVNQLTPKCGDTMAGDLMNEKCSIKVNGA
jgi:hypothetical protein